MATRQKKNGVSAPLILTASYCCFMILLGTLSFLELLPKEVLPPFLLIFIPTLIWVIIFTRQSYQQSYLPQLNPKRLRKSKLLDSCYYSASLDHSKGKLETVTLLYPPGSYFVDCEGCRQKVLRTGKKMRVAVTGKHLLPPSKRMAAYWTSANDWGVTIEVAENETASDVDIHAPLIINFEDRAALLKAVEWFRHGKGVIAEVRETLYDILDAKVDTCIPTDKLSQAKSYLLGISKPKSDSKKAVAIRRSLDILTELI